MQEWPTGADEKPPSGVSALHFVGRSPDESVVASEVAVQARARWAAEGILPLITASPPFAWPAADGEIWDARGPRLCWLPNPVSSLRDKVLTDHLPLTTSWSLPSLGLGGKLGLNVPVLFLWSIMQAEVSALWWSLLVLSN